MFVSGSRFLTPAVCRRTPRTRPERCCVGTGGGSAESPNPAQGYGAREQSGASAFGNFRRVLTVRNYPVVPRIRSSCFDDEGRPGHRDTRLRFRCCRSPAPSTCEAHGWAQDRADGMRAREPSSWPGAIRPHPLPVRHASICRLIAHRQEATKVGRLPRQ